MLRIVSGTAKNKKLIAPEIERYRAVQEIAKSAIFSIIGNNITGKNCLDLYAGSGNMGIEALSRGAGKCTFVDENPQVITVIEKNLFNCGFFENFQVIRKDVLKYIVSCEETYDFIFVDPFYSDLSHKHLLKNLAKVSNEYGIIFFMHAPKYDIQADLTNTNLEITASRRFGQSVITQLTKTA